MNAEEEEVPKLYDADDEDEDAVAKEVVKGKQWKVESPEEEEKAQA